MSSITSESEAWIKGESFCEGEAGSSWSKLAALPWGDDGWWKGGLSDPEERPSLPVVFCFRHQKWATMRREVRRSGGLVPGLSPDGEGRVRYVLVDGGGTSLGEPKQSHSRPQG